MACIKHIALVTDDPAQTAEFYKKHFGLTELYRRPTGTGDKGVWLSDGYIYFAILKYGDADAPKLGPGQTSDLRGIHHIGFQVDDLTATKQELERTMIKAAGDTTAPAKGWTPADVSARNALDAAVHAAVTAVEHTITIVPGLGVSPN